MNTVKHLESIAQFLIACVGQSIVFGRPIRDDKLIQLVWIPNRQFGQQQAVQQAEYGAPIPMPSESTATAAKA